MLLVAILVLTNTVSADGSIGGVYNASLQLAEQTSGKAKTEVEEITNPSAQPDKADQPPAKDDQQKDPNKSGANTGSGSNNR